ncbi:MAG TPA: riboflavin biosynthesis protein RibF [Candidatus Limnocylindria bacterium]|nr:riboflavin biosynthesis protein RibF [Candidatus Limnocylindria bacterium]
MSVVHDFAGWPRGALFVTVGVFDGVHRGHHEVIKRTAERAHAGGGRAIATTFDPLPIQVLAPAAPPFGLSDIEERTQLLHDAGADDVVIFHFTRQFAAMTPAEFIQHVTGAGEVRQIVVGEDFQFGHDRAGNVRTLTLAGPTFGFEVFVAPPVRVDGEVVSSTRVRNALLAGDLPLATRLLGRPYSVRATVTRGSEHGRGLGFPTIDLAVPPTRLLPRDGIYAMTLGVRDQRLPAVASVSVRPTPAGADRTLEAFLLEPAPHASDDVIDAVFVKRLRDDVRFATPAELSEQIARDVEAARKALS